MNTTIHGFLGTFLALGVLSLSTAALAQESAMTFFITSAGPGKGADLGGLQGADRHCQTLAQAAGAGNRTWRAYLSTQAVDGSPAVNARDRIGRGPWQNAKGVTIAKDIAELHGDNNLDKQRADRARGEGWWPRRHAEPARHAHRLDVQRSGLSWRCRCGCRYDLFQLDKQ